jgi:hypothetical protein
MSKIHIKDTPFPRPAPTKPPTIGIKLPESEWPQERVGNWGPGWYYCTCKSCGEKYGGDKYSFHCYPCAVNFEQEQITNNSGTGI